MINQLRKAVEDKKQLYIQRLLNAGIFKTSDRHLYSLTLSELENILKRIPRP